MGLVALGTLRQCFVLSPQFRDSLGRPCHTEEPHPPSVLFCWVFWTCVGAILHASALSLVGGLILRIKSASVQLAYPESRGGLIWFRSASVQVFREKA